MAINSGTFSANQMMGMVQTANLPSSKPLQAFLFVALLVTGGAYLANQWTERKAEDLSAAHASRLRHLANQNRFLGETALGREAEDSKKYGDAVAHYRKALFAQVTAEAHLNLARAAFEQGDKQTAWPEFKYAAQLDPGLEAGYTTWGRSLARDGKTSEATQLYQDALRFNPKFPLVHFSFAALLNQQAQAALAGQHAADAANQHQAATKLAAQSQALAAEALTQYAAAEQLGVNTPDFWRSYGTLLNEQGNHAQAEGCLNKAVTEQPGLAAAQFQLAVAQDRQGKYADAIGHYEAALRLMPDDPATLNNLALLYTTATNPEIRSPKMGIQLGIRASDGAGGQNARYMDTLARAYAADGDFFQAVAWEDKAVHRAMQLTDYDLLYEIQPRFELFRQHRSQ